MSHTAKACQSVNKKQAAVNKKPQNKWTRYRSTASIVTETTTEFEPDCVPLSASQSPGYKTDSRNKVQLEIQGIEMTMELDTGASVFISKECTVRIFLISPCKNQTPC